MQLAWDTFPVCTIPFGLSFILIDLLFVLIYILLMRPIKLKVEKEFLQRYESDDSESPDTENVTNKEVQASAVPSSLPNLNARAVRT